MAFGVEPPSAKRRLIPAVVPVALAVAAFVAVTPAHASRPKQPRGVEKLWSEYPLSVPERTHPRPAPTVTVARPAAGATAKPTGAAQTGDNGRGSTTPILLALAAAAVLLVAAVGRHALSTEGGTTMPDLFRSRGRRTQDDAEHRPAAGVALAAPAETSPDSQEPSKAAGGEARTKADDKETATPTAARDDAGRVGEHVAGIVAAAESAAATIRADAEREAERLRTDAERTLEDARSAAAKIKAEAEAYAETRRRDAAAAAARVVDEAERHALSIADDAAQRDRVLLANIEASEHRLRDLARSLRTVAASLDDVVGSSDAAETTVDETRPMSRAGEEGPSGERSLSRL
ncbi:MAG: hypothetical protein ACJ74N_16640 [Gaiellaceae bacterium]